MGGTHTPPTPSVVMPRYDTHNHPCAVVKSKPYVQSLRLNLTGQCKKQLRSQKYIRDVQKYVYFTCIIVYSGGLLFIDNFNQFPGH
jgi:hypothetical protein